MYSYKNKNGIYFAIVCQGLLLFFLKNTRFRIYIIDSYLFFSNSQFQSAFVPGKENKIAAVESRRASRHSPEPLPEKKSSKVSG